MIISHEPESYSLQDDNGKCYPALKTSGCGCCSYALPITPENLQQAITEAEEWLETLRGLSPVDYPPEVLAQA